MNNFANELKIERPLFPKRTYKGTCATKGCGEQTTVFDSDKRNASTCWYCVTASRSYQPKCGDDSESMEIERPSFPNRTHTGTCRFEGCGNRTTVYDSKNRNGEMCGECYMKLHPWKPPY